MMRRSFFTTFEISQICEVNPTTVQNWVKEKKLKAYVTPGGHRRVKREDLREFMREFGLPIPPALADHPYIMIVDDEAEMLDLLRTLFASGDEGIEIACVQSGVEALLMMGARKPNLLILDIMMPGMNGYEVCRRLKSSADTRNILILAITGDHDPSVRGRILEAGADRFFTKPLQVLEFREQVLQLIAGGATGESRVRPR
jgi:excisionase family DNA binding protein